MRAMHTKPWIVGNAFAFAAGMALSIGAVAAPWVPTGPADGGDATSYGAVATHPTRAGEAMIAAGYTYAGNQESIATFQTSDGGATWLANVRIPEAEYILLGGTPTVAYTHWGSQSGGMLRSFDLGRSWAPMVSPVFPGQKVTVRAVNAADGREVIATFGSTLFISKDAGDSWASSAAPGGISSLVVDWSTRTIYAAFGQGQPLGHRSVDAPGTWAVGGADPRVIAAAHGVVVYQDGSGALFRSVDGGNTFTPVGQPLGAVSLCDIEFANAPSQRVYGLECSTGRMIRSLDDGTTWEVAATLDGEWSPSSIAIDAGNALKFYVATRRGVFVSLDGAATFGRLSRAGQAPGTDHELFVDATNASLQWLCCARPKNGFGHLIQRSIDGGATFVDVTSEVYIVESSRERTNTLFGARDPGLHVPASPLFVSTDGGTTFVPKLSIPGAFLYGPMVYGPAPGQIFLYTSLNPPAAPGIPGTIHVSNDDGETWAPRFAPPLGVNAMAVTSTGPLTIFAGGSATSAGAPHLFRSVDGAVTWQAVGTFAAPPTIPGPPNGNTITALAIDPSNPSRIYAGFTYSDYILRSDDGGATWSRATSGLGAGTITSIVVDAANPSTLYASQRGSGVFRSTDRGDTWAAMDDGLHDEAVLGLLRTKVGTDRLYAMTGSGQYRFDLAGAPPSGDRRAIEFYHRDMNHYFVSADLDEIAGLDAGVFQGWARTGEGFRVADAGTPGNEPVCRFFTVSGVQSTHFYTPYAHECDLLKADPSWTYEKIAFGLALPDAIGGCPPRTRALHRLWNANQGGMPNHRYTTNMFTLDAMVAQGWIFEGSAATRVFACVPY